MRTISIQPWAIPGLVRSYMPVKRVPAALTKEIIADFVCQHFNITLRQLRAKNRTRGIAEARQILAYLLTQKTAMSLDEIGTFLRPVKPMHHTTVIYSRNTILNFLKTNPKIASDVFRIQMLIDAFLESAITEENTGHIYSPSEL